MSSLEETIQVAFTRLLRRSLNQPRRDFSGSLYEIFQETLQQTFMGFPTYILFNSLHDIFQKFFHAVSE